MLFKMREKTSVASKTMRFHGSALPSHFYPLNHLFIAWDCCLCHCVCFWDHWPAWHFSNSFQQCFFFPSLITVQQSLIFSTRCLHFPQHCSPQRSACRRNEKGVKKNRNTHGFAVEIARKSRQTLSPPPPYCRRCYICVHAHKHDWQNDVWWGWGFQARLLISD